ncbi:hypothetical protein [Streptomyces jumonjinensis]|uniref:hypothetical protein n=1 Tax=Streptomyces jumonjinensis TaxID=1945 RepID=UPI0037B99424
MPSPSPCDAISGAAREFCADGTDGAATPGRPEVDDLDPIQAFAKSFSDAAAWVADRLAGSIDGIATFDVTNGAFLGQYAVVFAASTVLTLLLWLIAVAKRAMRGVPLTTALGEAIGLLWLTVTASAFTPLILYVIVGSVDEITGAFSGGDGSSQLFKGMAATLREDEGIGGGPILRILVSLATIIAGGILWLELALRSVALYVGAVFAAVIYAGLVDRDLWRKVRVWVGFMVALILIKPVIAVCLGIASVFTKADGSNSAPIAAAGFAVIVLAIFASVQVFRFVPGYGDDIVSGLAVRAAVTGGRAGVRIAGSAAGIVSQGIHTHGTRATDRDASASQNKTSVSDGMQAHGNRKDKPEE